MKISLSRSEKALTLIEVLVILFLLLILTALILPRFARAKCGSHVNCISNLKQIGLGWLTWVHDNQASDFPYRVAATNGGTADNPDPLKNNAWWQFATISNELNSPQVLVCPADRNVGAPRKVADNWGTMETNEGFLAPGFRHLATSYTIGLDSRPQLTGDIERQDPGLVLGTDRNIQFDRSNLACSSGLLGSQAVKVRGKNNQNLPATATWTNAIHGLRGNVLAVDGSVQQANAKELSRLFDLNDDNGGIHFLVPK